MSTGLRAPDGFVRCVRLPRPQPPRSHRPPTIDMDRRPGARAAPRRRRAPRRRCRGNRWLSHVPYWDACRDSLWIGACAPFSLGSSSTWGARLSAPPIGSSGSPANVALTHSWRVIERPDTTSGTMIIQRSIGPGAHGCVVVAASRSLRSASSTFDKGATGQDVRPGLGDGIDMICLEGNSRTLVQAMQHRITGGSERDLFLYDDAVDRQHETARGRRIQPGRRRVGRSGASRRTPRGPRS